VEAGCLKVDHRDGSRLTGCAEFGRSHHEGKERQ
jgi:hypothetical protein